MKSQQDRFYLADGIMCCLPNARAKTKCLTFVDDKLHILTARERLRLQGYDDESIDKAYFVNEPDELAKQAGNGVTVNVIEAIARRFEIGTDQEHGDA